MSDQISPTRRFRRQVKTRIARAGTAVTLGAVVAAVVAAGAWAYFTATGAGVAHAMVGVLGAPTITSATPGDGSVGLSWSSVTPPAGSGAITYYVMRDGGTAGGSCPSAASPTAVTSCTDTGLRAGFHQYTVTAVWQSWTATSATSSVHVHAGTLDHYSVVAAASTTAGAPFSVTVTAQDGDNNTITDYTGTVHFTSSDAQAGLPADYTFVPGDDGSHTFTSGVTLKTAGSQSVAVSDTVQTLVTGSATVSVNAATASSLSLSAASTTVTAGTTDDLTITALDAYGNTATSYAGSKSLTFGGAHWTGSYSPTVSNSSGLATDFGLATTITFTGGVTTVSGSGNGHMVLYKAESTSITVSDGTITNGAGLAVTVGPATASSLSLSAATTTPTAGATDNLSITALDAYGNIATGYTGSKSLTFSGGLSIGGFTPSVTNSSASPVSFGTATTTRFSAGVASPTTSGASGQAVVTLYDAGPQNLTVSDGTVSSASSPVQVTVGAANAISFGVPTPVTQAAGTAFNETLTALDAYGNTATGYTGSQTVTFTGPASSPGGNAPSYPASVTFIAGAGTASVILYDAQTTTLTATQGSTTGTSGSFTVSPGAAHSFSVPTPATQTAGTAFNETLTEIDAYGNTATGYTGSQTVTFTGPASSPAGNAPSYPAAVTFTAGTGTASITLYDAQTTTLTATQGSTTGTSGSFTVSPGAAHSFSVPTPAPAPTAGTAFNETLTEIDAYGNTATGYTGSQTVTFTGPASSPNNTAPSYPASVTFTAGTGTASITLYDAQTTALTATQGSTTGTSGSFTVAPATTHQIGASASSPQTAGTAFNLTLTAQDTWGNATGSLSGTKTISFSGPAHSPNGNVPAYPASVSFSAGAGTASITLYDAQTTTVTATDTTDGLGGAPSNSIAVSGAGTHSFTVPTPGPAPTAGTAFNETLTALDAYGNTATGYTGSQTLTFTGPASSPGGNAPSYPASVTFTAGTGTASITLYDAQTTTLTATQGSTTGTSGSFTVSPGAAHSFSVPTPATQTAGTAFNVTLTEVDPYGNTATGYTGSQTVTFTGPASSPAGNAPSYPAAVTFTAGTGTASITLYDAQTTTLTATQGSTTGTSGSFTVSGLGVSRLAITSGPVSGASSATANLGPVTVQEQDQYGNATTSAETVSLSSSSGTGLFATSQFGAAVTSVSIPSGQSSATFYYGDQNTGSPVITGAKAGLTSGTQQETITAAPAGLGIALAPGSTGSPSISCGAVSTSYTCAVTGVGNSGSVVFYATFVNSSGAQVTYSSTQASTITETGHDTGSATIAAGASSSSPNTLTASHQGASTKTSTLTFGPYTLTITVSS